MPDRLDYIRFLQSLLTSAALLATAAAAQTPAPLPNGHVVSGTLSFDGHATAGDFTGTTSTITGQFTGGSDVTAVRGWVEAPVKTLKTGNGKRDKDLNKSMESEKYPVLRFELARVSRNGGGADSTLVTLHGGLSLHGVTRNVDLPATIHFTPGDARLRTDFPVNLKDYRIGGLSKLLGMLKMDERIQVHANLVFRLGTGG